LSARDILIERVQLLQPAKVLDVCCGCGSFTSKLADCSGHVTAIDISERLLERSRRENGRVNIEYVLMDARALTFSDKAFDLVLVRASLHHVYEWQLVIDEMLRVACGRVFIVEPLDDPRSEAKRNTMKAQNLFLEIQSEVGYSHFPYIKPDVLTAYLSSKGCRFETEIERSDESMSFEDFFSPWEHFAAESDRRDYWSARLGSFRSEVVDKGLCRTDTYLVTVFA
jgi:2-polyprenyl-3-methyl-5-hydroxy-6-metoxy-1,4-benzoquinol methylase